MAQHRIEDMDRVRDHVERKKGDREARFTLNFESIMGEKARTFQAEQGATVREHQQDTYRRAVKNYERYTTEVTDRVQAGLRRKLAMDAPDLPRILTPREVGGPRPPIRMPLSARSPHTPVVVGRDPLQRCLTQHAQEEHFRRQADRVLTGAPDDPSEIPPGDLARYRTRPSLEPCWWSSVAIQSTPYGHFAQVCDADFTGSKRTTKRREGHIPDERDGVMTAGKRIDLATGVPGGGILVGQRRHLGSCIDNKTRAGASSGAPNQDHYQFPVGRRVTDGEFPRAKRIWANPPGAVPRALLAD